MSVGSLGLPDSAMSQVLSGLDSSGAQNTERRKSDFPLVKFSFVTMMSVLRKAVSSSLVVVLSYTGFVDSLEF